MDLGRPLADIIPGPRGQLLATLAQLEAPVTVRALARYADVAPQTALNVVNDLADAGIVSAERAGSAQMITLNRAHILAEPLISLRSGSPVSWPRGRYWQEPGSSDQPPAEPVTVNPMSTCFSWPRKARRLPTGRPGRRS